MRYDFPIRCRRGTVYEFSFRFLMPAVICFPIYFFLKDGKQKGKIQGRTGHKFCFEKYNYTVRQIVVESNNLKLYVRIAAFILRALEHLRQIGRSNVQNSV